MPVNDNVAVEAKQDWLDNHSHQFELYQQPKPIDVDGKLYLPGVYGTGLPNEDWAANYIELGHGE